jgi:hypothetical protein
MMNFELGKLEHKSPNGRTGNDVGLTPQNWTTMFQYQEMVKFINE